MDNPYAGPHSELHAHLSGCVPPIFWRDLLVSQGHIKEEDLSIPRDLMNIEPKRNLRDYFRPWELIRLVKLDESLVGDLMLAALKHLADDGIGYVELRHSVTHMAKKSGVAIEKALFWILDSIEKASAQTNVDARLIVSFVRHEWDESVVDELRAALENTATSPLVVGVDVTGDEDYECPRSIVDTVQFCGRELNLGVTIHAGETGLSQNIAWAIDECGADRIGHGLAAGSNQKLLKKMRDADVCVEVCMTSNFLTGRVGDLSSHPVVHLVENQVPFVICTDNPQMHAKNLASEYKIFEEVFGFREELECMNFRAIKYKFGDPL